MWVFDATPLIYLAKAGQLDLLEQLDERRVIPETVYDEVVVTGLDQGYPDARRLERAVDDGVFDVVQVEESPLLSRLRRNQNLSGADATVLAHAATHDGVAVMDETYGRDVADAEGITTRGTAYLVLLLASRAELSADEARRVIDAMIDEGWYCAPDVYATILRQIDSIAE